MLETLRLIKLILLVIIKLVMLGIPAEADVKSGVVYDSPNPALEKTGSYSGGSGSDTFNKNIKTIMGLEKA